MNSPPLCANVDETVCKFGTGSDAASLHESVCGSYRFTVAWSVARLASPTCPPMAYTWPSMAAPAMWLRGFGSLAVIDQLPVSRLSEKVSGASAARSCVEVYQEVVQMMK